MSVIIPSDQLYKYCFKFSHVLLKHEYRSYHLIEIIYQTLVSKINLLDIRDLGSARRGYNVDRLTVGIMTFEKLNEADCQWICDPKTYESIAVTMDPITYQDQVMRADELEMNLTLYKIDEHGFSGCDFPYLKTPLVGLYKGFYPNMDLSRRKKCIDYMYEGSWECKNPKVIDCLRERTNEKIRDISLDIIGKNEYWSFGFGFDDM